MSNAEETVKPIADAEVAEKVVASESALAGDVEVKNGKSDDLVATEKPANGHVPKVAESGDAEQKDDDQTPALEDDDEEENDDSNGTVEEKNGTIGEKNGTVGEKNGTVEEKNGTAEEKNGTAEEKNGTLEESNGTVEEKKAPKRDASEANGKDASKFDDAEPTSKKLRTEEEVVAAPEAEEAN
ncbi:hypothetical protein M3Y98_01199500 [Aphelenchoides besseyi]|nr:hypothetical protein M3Y98_01199500 [Aphelenchoides besseyi]KAI6193130.1 hypothetical protein M3Y96_00985600 [Aphelenchoides besseyi]